MQFNIFDYLKEDFKITKKLRIIECFAGIGAQTRGIKNLYDQGFMPHGFEHYKMCEWAIPSILAYASIHRDILPDYGTDYTNGMSTQDIINYLFNLGVSINYNEPAKLEQLKRMSDKKLRLIYNSIKWENNLVDVSRVKGDDLGIENTDKYDYLLSYSFP